MKICRFAQSAADTLLHTFDYCRWLYPGEQLSTVALDVETTTSPALALTSATIDTTKTKVTFFASAGVEGYAYDASITITTSLGQTKKSQFGVSLCPGDNRAGVYFVIPVEATTMVVEPDEPTLVVQ